MRVVVTGSRDWDFPETIRAALDALPDDAVIVHGACPTGADQIADRYARARGLVVETHPADWNRHGKAAGPIRNREMLLTLAPPDDLVLAFLKGNSRGTSGCIHMALQMDIPVTVHSYPVEVKQW